MSRTKRILLEFVAVMLGGLLSAVVSMKWVGGLVADAIGAVTFIEHFTADVIAMIFLMCICFAVSTLLLDAIQNKNKV